MRKLTVALLISAALAPVAANAGLVLGAGTGLGKAGGYIGEGVAMSDYASFMVPVQLEAGWKFADRLTVVGFFNMNFGILSGDFKTVCDAFYDDCLVNQSRVGAQARWSFWPDRQLDPWVGAGVAWEVLGVEASSSTISTTINFQGTGFDLAAGVDYWVSPRLSLSPYVGLSLGKYTEGKVVSAFEDWSPIPSSEQRMHSQLTVGVRVGWDFGGTPRVASDP
jgi:hypothetical protein